MWTHSIIPNEIKSFDYYLRKVPLFLRQSDSFIEHFRIWFDLLNGGQTNHSGIVPTADCLLYLLNIFDDDYLNFINSLDDNNSGTTSDILDKLAVLFGVSRVFSLSRLDDNDNFIVEELRLDNNDLLVLIKLQIVKQYCDGTAVQIEDFYDSIGLKVYVITTDVDATAHLYLANIPGLVVYSENINKMFTYGMLRIESLGIAYDDSVQTLEDFLIWDTSSGAAQGWGRGLWAE